MERKLTAILCADVFGYSRLMGENEEATLGTLSSYRKLIDSLIEQHRGRFVNSAGGDSVLAEFASVVNAVQCAVEIQTTLKAENAKIPPERRMEFRIGVNLGDVMVDGVQIYGEGVNVAARLESLAEPGSIFISGSVHEQLGNKLAIGYDDLGEQSVKNIAKPVRVYRVLTEPGFAATATKKTQRVPSKYVRRGVFSLAGLAILGATVVFVQHLSLKPPTTRASIPPTQSPALPLPNIPSIAVLPFANMSGDRKQEYFSDGITNDLITDLSKGQDIFVIDRASTFTYKGKPARVQDVSRELGVKYVLEGGVQKAGDQVRISVQLVDATTGADLWAERYNRPLRDIFALQDEIVRRIVTTLNLRLTLWEKYGILVRKRTDNLEAYDDLLRGMQYAQTLTRDGNEKARQMFDRAIQLDPGYSDAYTALSFQFFQGYAFLWEDQRALDRAAALAEKSIALDDSNAAPYAVRGWIAAVSDQPDTAIADGRRAVSLGPNNAFACIALANILIHARKPEEALVYARKAMRLNPRHPEYYREQEGFAYYRMGRYAEALDALKKSSQDDPRVHLALVITYSELGREQEACAEAAEVMRLSPQFSLKQLEQREPAWMYNGRLLADLRKAGLK